MLEPTAIYQAATDLLNCVCQALALSPVETPGVAGCPCRVYVSPGTPAADACDGGCDMQPGEYPGQLTVHVARIYASDRQNFPRETGQLSTPGLNGTGVRDLRNCAMPQVTAIELIVTLWRCTPLPSDDGCPPTAEELDANAMQLAIDMYRTQQGILCCYAGTLPEQRHGRRYVVGPTLSLGPQGGCAGFQSTVTVALDDCLPCPPAEPLTGP